MRQIERSAAGLAMKTKGNWLWFLVWRTPEHGVQVKAVCGYERRDALENVRAHCSASEWRQMQRDGARLERIFVRPNNQAQPDRPEGTGSAGAQS